MDINTFFIEKNGTKYTGSHVIVDLFSGSRLDDIKHMEETFLKCISTCGANLLHMHFHHFTENGGISGVAVLSESHISVHSWPEYGYGAFDIFMCGKAEPLKAIPILKEAFKPKKIIFNEILRGQAIFDIDNK